ncbi:MAG: 6-phosphofructokinase [Candidatus Delongbacteria bacterium]|nr:6-phosphofructokinase [Candidatus Delongbacteria bacterium]MBN2834310.1 6-phosphofructokinase [Candidatus Delongbacteria bacterium]
MEKSIAILCGGGPAPGINTVVSTISKRFLTDGYRVIGINHGYKTLFADSPDTIDINFDFADRIFDRGGSALKMSRYKPKDSEFKADFFSKNNVKLLVTIGGDDTASTANRLTKYLVDNDVNIQNIHVPKTIDNDLPLPGKVPTFGFQSAKNEAAKICTTVYEDARTSGNWFTIVTMGREAGHLAFGIGASIHAPMIIIPEMFVGIEPTFNKIIKMIISSMIKRKIDGIDYGAVVISEGLFHFMSQKEILNSGINFTYDDHGHPELGNVSKAHIFNVLLQRKLKQLGIDIKSRPVEIGYEVRCTDPIAFDLKYCTNLGNGVKRLYDRGETGCIVVAHPDGKIEPLYLKDIADENGKIKPRLVDIMSEEYIMVQDSLCYLRESDYESARKYISDPEEYDLKHILRWK